MSLDTHVNSVSATAWPFASVAAAASRSVSPVNNVSVAGSTATVATACATVTIAVLDTCPAVAVMVAVPLATAVTSPVALAVTKAVLLLDQATATPDMTRPCWSRTSAVSRDVSWNAVNATFPGVTTTVVGTGETGGVGSVAGASPQDRPRARTGRSRRIPYRLAITVLPTRPGILSRQRGVVAPTTFLFTPPPAPPSGSQPLAQ